MMKRIAITTLLLTSILTLNVPVVAHAASLDEVQIDGTITETITGHESSNTNIGFLNELEPNNDSKAVGVCVDYLEVDKKLFSDSCRLLGETSISGGVTWDIAMELTLFKNGRYATSASKRSNQTSYYCAGTKYVSGKKSQFTGNGQFRVYDDNGVKIHSKSLYID